MVALSSRGRGRVATTSQRALHQQELRQKLQFTMDESNDVQWLKGQQNVPVLLGKGQSNT